MHVRVRVCACVCVCVCVCVCCVYACMCVLDGEGRSTVASRAQVVIWMAMYLINFSDYLTSSCEPTFISYRCHTSLKNVWHNH